MVELRVQLAAAGLLLPLVKRGRAAAPAVTTAQALRRRPVRATVALARSETGARAVYWSTQRVGRVGRTV